MDKNMKSRGIIQDLKGFIMGGYADTKYILCYNGLWTHESRAEESLMDPSEMTLLRSIRRRTFSAFPLQSLMKTSMDRIKYAKFIANFPSNNHLYENKHWEKCFFSKQ
ncbi:hypothetical protein WA026_005428 [Henosepilachna vigintioctopunctata]|uniref:Uncharacterized protein n=1 Tax=Henosepilachna vigintioctopunctata TaxID=420089 RepID=A0AAW1TUX7_9CUCU